MVGLPKTIDNDVIPIRQSLGAWTAAEQGALFARNVIAHASELHDVVQGARLGRPVVIHDDVRVGLDAKLVIRESLTSSLRPAARAYWEIFSHVTENSGIAELPQIKPLAQVPARLSAISALPPLQMGGCGF